MMNQLGRIVTKVTLNQPGRGAKRFEFEGFVDTGADHLVLPMEWKKYFPNLQTERLVKFITAEQRHSVGHLCGPLQIELDGFDPIWGEVLFIAMEPFHGKFEPLVGHLVLQSCQAIVDMKCHQLSSAGPIYVK